MTRGNGQSLDFVAAARDGRLEPSVRAWIEGRLPGAWRNALRSGDAEALRAARRGFDETGWWHVLAEAGLAAPAWPVEAGGLGLSAEDAGIVARLLREYKTPRSANPIGHNMVAPALLRWGNDGQRARHLPAIADQTEIWCQLFSEPGAGSDLASLATRARRDGTGWKVTGQKVWTSIGHRAHWGLLLARTDADLPKHEGITAFLVDMHAPGVEVRPLRQITGDAEFNEVFLDEVGVPDVQRLGQVGQGWAIARAVLAQERVSDSGGGVLPGVIAGRGVGELIRRHRPVTDLYLRDRLVMTWVSERGLSLTVERSRQAHRSDATGVDGTVTKLVSTRHSQELQDLAVELGGASGIAWAPEDRWAAGTAWSFLRVQAKTIAGGTLDITKNLCGERVLGLEREPSADRGRPWSAVPRSRVSGAQRDDRQGGRS